MTHIDILKVYPARKTLDDEIVKAKTYLNQQQLVKQEEERQWQETVSRCRIRHALEGPQRISLAKEIFSWGKEFARSRTYRSLMGVAEFPFLGGNLKDALWIYSGRYGHDIDDPRIDEPSFGLWSRFYLTRKGTYVYRSGYRSFGFSGPELRLDTPGRMAKKLHLPYLKRVHTHLDSGKIYEYLAEELKEHRGRYPITKKKCGVLS